MEEASQIRRNPLAKAFEMNRSFPSITFSVAVGLAAALTLANDAAAQIAIGPFGGVSVRAPFVGVDVLPFGGGTRVRAPFTSVNTGLYGVGYGGLSYGGVGYGDVGRYGYGGYGGYGYRGYGSAYRAAPIAGYRGYGYPTYGYGYGYGTNSYVRESRYDVLAVPVPVYRDRYFDDPGYVYPEPIDAPEYDVPSYHAARPPMPVDRPMGSTGSLEDDLRIAADRLTLGLTARRDDADVWMDYLKPDLIVETIDGGGSPDELRSLLLNYEGLSGNSQLSAIWVTDGFRQTHRLLRQWIETTPSVSVEDTGSAIYEDPYADSKPTRLEPGKPPTDRDANVETLPTPEPKQPEPKQPEPKQPEPKKKPVQTDL